MAIAKMLKLRLVGVNAKQNEILNAMHKTCAVELTTPQDFNGFEKTTTDKSELKDKKERLESALSVIVAKCKATKADCDDSEGFAVSYGEFTNIVNREEELLSVVDKTKENCDKIAKLNAEILFLESEIASLKPYLEMNEKFSDFKRTGKTVCKLGTVERVKSEKLGEKLSEIPCSILSLHGGDEKQIAVSVIYHESVTDQVEGILSECAFIRCPVTGDYTAEEKTEQLKAEIQAKLLEIKKLEEEIVSFAKYLRDIKILSDYYSFETEKLESADQFEKSASTFYLEGFVPEDSKEVVNGALKQFEGQIYYEYESLGENDFAPTLMKNNKVTSNFEFVTNLYSVPKYLEFDPNAIMGIFFCIFMGFMLADVFYGLAMTVGGFLFNARKKRKTGINKLANVMAMSGIPTMIFGFLFDSWLGLPLLRSTGIMSSTIMPDPVNSSSMLMGINIPTLLLICLGMGVIHIMFSLLVSAYIQFKKGKIFDGICDGVIWALFLLGLMLFVFDQTGAIQGFGTVSVVIIVGSVVLGALTAGRHAKGIGKFTKGFGAVYGLINYMSDILSYARLYGLMLSGAKIAEIFSQQLALPVMQNGVGGVIFGVLIMLVGNVFNLAMNLLGSFIHDARLQYVEFFSHFYTGDGELFTPVGSSLQHIYID